MVLVVVGAEVLVVSADRIILLTGLQETFVGLVVTAFVTNAEEFWLSVNSIRKGHTELGVSAQIGKIMWNISLIYGICGVIIYQLSSRLVMEVSTLIFLGVVCLMLYNLSKGKLSRAKGASYVAICLAFLAFNFLFAF
jgi:cation:H+ antiporter